MKTELQKKLTSCGVKKSKIELDLGMPKNSLSGMLSGIKPTSKKWEDALTEYVDKLGSEENVIEAEKEPKQDEAEEKQVNPPQKEKEPVETPKNDKLGYRVLSGKENDNFDVLLREFNKLVENNPKSKSLLEKLNEIKLTAQYSKLTPRQTDAIVDRINFYNQGLYVVAKG